jgi:hypothetical protein
MKASQIQEIQGLYGPFTVAERVLQKAWLRRYFAPGELRLKSGKPLEVLHAGRWNHQEGPDFIGAQLRIDGVERVGDVEVHFTPQDWRDHGHSADPAFRSVILHVVFFDEVRTGPIIRNAAGEELETFVMGRFMREDLETFAHEDALLEMESRDAMPWAMDFLQMPAGERQGRILMNARLRWRQKVHYAEKRLQRMGWEQACHSSVLEVLGYRRNRVPMASLAETIPFSTWQSSSPDPLACLSDKSLRWRLNGLRPANHPIRRLRDYNAFVAKRCDWPVALQSLVTQFQWTQSAPSSGDGALFSSRSERSRLKLSDLRKQLLDYCKGLAGVSRLDTLMVDAILPLWAATQPQLPMEAYWLHWPVGDVPPCCRDFVREAFAADGMEPVFNNGLLQGALQLYFNNNLSKNQL